MSELDEKETRPESDIYGASVNDGMLNVASGFGTAKARDPYTRLSYDHNLGRGELEDIYRYYWISKAVDIKPWDMTREWRTFSCSDLDDNQLEAIKEEERKVDIVADTRQAMILASIYGGGSIVMHVDGHGDAMMPLNVNQIKKGQLNRLTPVDRWSLIESGSIDYNPLSPVYGEAEFYYVANDPSHTLIHRSRIVRFPGRKMPIRIERELKVWGDSDLQRWYKAITNSETLAAGLIEGVHQSNLDIVKVKGLSTLLAQQGGESKAINRFMIMDKCKSMLNMSVLDAEDDLTRNAFPFASLPDIYRIFLEVLSAATDIPITRLLGSSPSGLNATGEGDVRNYYDMIRAQQINDLSPKLYQIDQVLIRSALGNYPKGLCFEFNPLWQMTPEEKATMQLTQVQTLAGLQALGVDNYTLQRDAIELGLVSNLTIEDVDAMEKADDFDVEEGNEDFKPMTNEPEVDE